MDASRSQLPRSDNKLENILNTASRSTELGLVEEIPFLQDGTAIAISIISNSRLLSEGIFALLSPRLHLNLVGIYTGEYYTDSSLLNPPGHVILLDSGVGRVAALAWTQLWHELTPPAYVLIVESTNNIELILACIEVGAEGFLLQNTSGAQMVEAIREAHTGVTHCSSEDIAQLSAGQAAVKNTFSPSLPSPLTNREIEVLHWITKGYTNLEIAVRLVIELRTVKQHVHHILGKLHLRSRWEVARLAAERGWLDPT